jgi:hypothetical protein
MGGSVNPQINCKYDKLVPVYELKGHGRNANKHPKSQVERLAKLFEYQGIRHPIIVSKLSGCIVAGHGRLEALKHLKADTAPVVYQEFTDQDQETAFIHSDNTIADWAELDLAMINDQLKDFDPSFDIDLLGLEDFEIEPADKYNRGDEKELFNELVGEFESGDKYIKLTFIFENEDKRAQYVEENAIDVKTRRSKYSWLVYPT